jgi:ABC-type sugar transport system substrate-binding protein
VLQAIQEGTVTGTVAQDDAAMAFWAMQVLFNFKHNQAPLTADNAKAGVITGPSQVLMTVNWVDKSNLQYFLDANKLYTQ